MVSISSFSSQFDVVKVGRKYVKTKLAVECCCVLLIVVHQMEELNLNLNRCHIDSTTALHSVAASRYMREVVEVYLPSPATTDSAL